MSNNVEVMNSNLAIVAGHFPAMQCGRDADCNDHDASTVDTCTVHTGVCVFSSTPVTNAPTRSPPALEGHLESFVVTGVTPSMWQTRYLRRAYTSPVIVCTVQHYGTKDTTTPAVVRMRSVQSRSFDLQVVVPGASATAPAAHTVHCLAAEQGVWTLPDGRPLEAQMYLSRVTDGPHHEMGERQTFHHSYETPVVVGQVMSSQDVRWSTFWTNSGGDDWSYFTTGKRVGVEEGHSTTRANEMIGMIVMEGGHGMVAGVEVQSGRGVGPRNDNRSSSFRPPFRWNLAPRVMVASPLLHGSVVRNMTDAAASTSTTVDKTAEEEGRVESYSYIAFGVEGLISLGT